MVIAILSDELIKEEFLSKSISDGTELVWADSIRSLGIIDADAYFDLLFEFDKERIERLAKLLPRPVFVNSVIHTVKEMRQPFIRINAWPTMLKRNITELASAETEISSINSAPASGIAVQEKIKNIFTAIGWQYLLVPDTTGMVTPRIISMIINEACYTLGDGISTKPEIDTAMKLGTNYPYGPFEWTEKIGPGKVKSLLMELSKTDSRYTIAPALINQQ